MMYSPCRVIALVVIAATSCLAQSVASPSGRFDQLVRTETDKGQSAATAVAVVFQGQIVYAKALGLADVETKQPLSLDSVWRSGALSHAYSYMVFALLGREGVLDLDKPVGTYWPELNRQLGRATVRQLLESRAGIKDEHVDYPIWDVGNLRKYALSFDASSIIAEPGYILSYSTPSGNLAAAVAEQVSGKDFNDLLESRVFRPMGFSRTSLSILRIATQPIAQGHQKGAAGWEVVRPLGQNIIGWPFVSVFTSASEAISFLEALVEEGQWKGRQVFPKPAVADTLSLLQNQMNQSGAVVIQDTTAWAGVVTGFWLIPEKRFGLIIFSSGFPPSRSLVTSLLSGARAIWLGEGQTAAPSAPVLQPTSLTESQAADLVGLYRNEHMIRLEWKDGSLMFHVEGASWLPPSDWIAVKRLSDTRYVLEKPYLYGQDLSVVRSVNGTVTHIVYGGRAYHKEESSLVPPGK